VREVRLDRDQEIGHLLVGMGAERRLRLGSRVR